MSNTETALPAVLTRVPRDRVDGWLESLHRHPQAVDAFWAVLSLLFVAVMVAHELAMAEPDGAILPFALCGVVASLALVFRSRRPLVVMGVVVGAQIVSDLVGITGPLIVMVCIALAGVVRLCSLRPAAAWTAVAMVSTVVGVVRGTDPGYSVATYLFASWFPLLFAVLVGVLLGARQEKLAARDKALQAAVRELQDQAEQRHLGDRVRVANDLHDSVGHGLTAIVALSSGAQLSLPDHPDEASEALRFIETTARDCLDQTRDAVDRLHEPQAPGADPAGHGADALVPLLATARQAGLTVSFDEPEPCDVPSAVEDACYHLVQEGLTNVLRHARNATTVHLSIAHGDRQTVLDMTDDGDPLAIAGQLNGHGLSGLRSRVEALGGTIDAGPANPRGWRMHAVLPWEGR